MTKYTVILFFALLASGCEGKTRHQGPGAAATAEAVWHRQELAVENALKGASKGDEFGKACIFFQHLTGIQVHGEGTFIGWIPTKETRADLWRLREWHREHQGRIYWDEEKGAVVIRHRG